MSFPNRLYTVFIHLWLHCVVIIVFPNHSFFKLYVVKNKIY